MLAVCTAALFGGYALKAQCLKGFDGRQYERLCYNDIQPLYGLRGVEAGTFPYVDGSLVKEPLELRDGAIEYPVLTGVFMWASGQPVSDANAYLRVSTLLLAPFGLVTAYLLVQMRSRRALLWAAAPAIVLYAFHNWDLLVVAAAVGGFWAWQRQRYGWAAVLFGIGAALKMYPVLFLAPLALERWMAGDRKGAIQSLGFGLGVLALINLPFALANYDGWFATYDFHRLRGPNFDNIWALPRFGLESLPADELNTRTAFLTAAFSLIALGFGWLRGKAVGAYPFVQVSAALLVAFLLWNKVHSPQYTLWLLPFFVLVPLRAPWAVGWWAAYSVVDLLVYVGVFRYFYDFSYRGLTGETFARGTMVFGVWTRAALLLALFLVFLFARSEGRSGPSRNREQGA
ncbi:MAG: glycosyltransferase family 87 protein [Actinomycetota bacterium]